MNILVDGQTLESPEIRRGIGVYFKNTLNYMVKRSYIHEWYITVSDETALNHLDPWVKNRLIPIVNPIFQPTSDYSKSAEYTCCLQQAVEQYSIDLYWNPDPLMVNVLFPIFDLNCRMIVTLYDLIPLVMPVKEWSSSVKQEYFRRVGYLKKSTISKLCISEATKKDFIQYTGCDENLIVTLLAADHKQFYTKRKDGGIKNNPTIVFTGGFDYRKNIEGALEAFTEAVKSAETKHPIRNASFYFVCHTDPQNEENFYAKAQQLGVRSQVQLTGYISDEALKELYAACDLFFFPSLYEGFGLPILEAMLGGAYILSADNSSLPEVCNGYAMLCDAHDIGDMAQKLRRALECAAEESAEEKNKRQEYALGYSWEKTAAATLACFEQINNEPPARKRKLALITPWPEQQTGIANYVYKILPNLSNWFDVDVFVDNTVVGDVKFWDNPYGALYMIKELDHRHHEYDCLLYQIGNSSEFHTGVYQYLKKYSGIAEIHDYVLHPFFYHSFFLTHKYQTYRDALETGYGAQGRQHYTDVYEKIVPPDNDRFPMAHSVARISKGVIVHNHWSVRQLQQETVKIIPHACFDKEASSQADKTELLKEIREKFTLSEEQFILSVFGFVNENKRPKVILQSIKQLLDDGYDIKLVFWGKSNIKNIREELRHLGLEKRVIITGFIDKATYEAGLELSDLVVNLRFPSMGESSGTLCEAFKYGKAVLVSDINQYTEFPDEVCWKVPVGQGEVKCLTEMIKYLLDNPETRRVLGKNAQAYADTVLSPKEIARLYRDILYQY